ncbi:MAG: hypothetical protein K0S34_1855 [Bacillales bacterium]|jgi:stage 0 sporulation protein B (sporulation initiation phosphotransferase)|nr:hypothetical protein [Bacillales bacterium]
MDKLDIIRLIRHDWLNRLQVIQGNIVLEKYDTANEYIKEVIHKERNSSVLATTEMPKVTFLLLSHNWKSSPIILDFEVTGEVFILDSIDDSLEAVLKNLIQVLEKYAVSSSNHFLNVDFGYTDSLTIYIDYNGEQKELDEFKNWLKSLDEMGLFKQNLIAIENKQISFEIMLTKRGATCL